MPRLPPAPLSPLALAARLTWGIARGTTLDPLTASLLAAGLGGVVLFERNVADPGQVARLIADLRAAAGGRLLVAVDQEGGHIIRLGEPLTRFPSAMALGATGSPRLAFEVARSSARELRALGIDVVLAPVLDVAAEPGNPAVGARSLGDDPALVATLGAAMVRGYLAGGVVPVPKHFPGHGRTALDSHLTAPLVEGGRPALEALDLPPFAAAIAAGAPALMVGHVAYRGVGGAIPASLEPDVYRLARRDLGFRGTAVTDALVMDSITARGGVPAAAVEAIAAGADIVMALDPDAATIRAIAEAIRSGRLPPRRATQAHRRALALGRRLSPAAAPMPDDEAPERHAALADEVSRASLTLVEDPAGILPLGPGTSICLVECGSGRVSPIEDGTANRVRLAGALGSRFPRLDARWIPAGDAEAAAAAIRAAAAAEVVVLATRDAAALGPGLAHDLATSLGRLGRPVVHIALRGPADLAGSGATTRIAVYADVPATLAALADALLAGAAAFPGQLPVRLEPPGWRRELGPGAPDADGEAVA